MVPALIWIVESSRREVAREGGRVPCHPGVGSRGIVRCSLWRTVADGMRLECLAFDDRGRKVDSKARESKIHWARRS